MLLEVLSGMYLCTIIKIIWTPARVLFGGACAIWLLAAFYLIIDVFTISLSTPRVVIGITAPRILPRPIPRRTE